MVALVTDLEKDHPQKYNCTRWETKEEVRSPELEMILRFLLCAAAGIDMLAKPEMGNRCVLDNPVA